VEEGVENEKLYGVLLVIFLFVIWLGWIAEAEVCEAPDGYICWYVATNGSDSNNGSFERPFRTIQYAINNMGGGDIIYLRNGIYQPTASARECIHIPLSKSGNTDAGSTLKSYPGEWAVLENAISTVYNYVILATQSGEYNFTGTFMFENMSNETEIRGDTGGEVMGTTTTTATSTTSTSTSSTTSTTKKKSSSGSSGGSSSGRGGGSVSVREESCFDGIQNQNETGIDCGGSCQPCPSCTDGVLNQGEQGIECGGPCMPCVSSTSTTSSTQVTVTSTTTTLKETPTTSTLEQTTSTTTTKSGGKDYTLPLILFNILLLSAAGILYHLKKKPPTKTQDYGDIRTEIETS